MKILSIGYGNMGKAIVNKLTTSNLFNEIHIVDPSLLETVQNKNTNKNLFFYNNYNELDLNIKFDFILIAIKPQSAEEILKEYKKYNSAIFLSILAGKKVSFFQNVLGENTKIIRLMPNITAQVGYSITFTSYSQNIEKKEKELVNKIIGTFGTEIEIIESEFDKGTVLTGCFPAYIYLFANLIYEKAIEYGFDEEIAEGMMKDSLIGSVEMLKLTPELSFQEMTSKVTSKGGVTEAVLSILSKDLEKSINKAFLKGIKKSKELSS